MFISRPRQVPGDDFTNPLWASLPDSHYRLMTALRLMTDPAGRGVLSVPTIRKEAWQAGPEGASWPSLGDVETYLLELAEAGWIRFYPDPKGSGVELFQIAARWPAVFKQGEPKWAPPPDPEIGEIPPFRKAVVGGERAGAGAGAGAGARASERAGPSGMPDPPRLRITPSRFCHEHPGGPPPDLDCRNCGTSRLRQEEHKEFRIARTQALKLPAALRGPVLEQLDAKLAALEEAAAAALTGDASDGEDPVEFVDEHGRVDCT